MEFGIGMTISNKNKIKMSQIVNNYIRENLDELSWDVLSSNSSAIELLKENPDKIWWRYLCFNSKPLFIKWRQNIYKFYFHLKYKSN